MTRAHYITGSSGVDEDCPYQTTELVHSGAGTGQRNEGLCATWGNPMSEIFLESLRYLAGKSANPAFQAGGSGKDAKLGLKEATWVDPLSNANFCAPLNVLLFNTASSTYDDDQFAGISDIGASTTAQSLTTQVGAMEGINGKSWFVGNIGATITDNCTPKVVGGLGDVNGICPESAAYNGTYLMAGIAYQAHTNKIRTDLTIPPDPNKLFTRALKVDTYGIALATTTPKIVIPVPGVAGQKVTILPAYRLDLGTRFGGGTIVDFKVVRQDLAGGTGRFYVNWEDSGFGGDYDQDVIGIIDYCVKTASTSCTVTKPDGSTFVPPNDTVTVSTDVIAAATANPQGFGYVISGTKQDGVHYHSGIYGFTYPPAPQTIAVPPSPNNYYPAVALDAATNGVLGCAGCNITDPRTSWTYELIGGSTAATGTLEDPLYYAAKYGAFKDANDDGMVNSKCDWDSKKGDGSEVVPCTVTTGDGIPDTFFYVTNPNALESALDKAFVAILKNSSASSVAANSTSLRTGTRIYQARFNSNDWSGELRALDVDTQGNVATTATWLAQDVLNTQNWSSGRKILTYNTVAKDGAPFTWTGISPAQQAFLNINPATGSADGFGDKRLAYLRGDTSNEGNGGSSFRSRTSVLGDIVNSNPVYVGPPDAGYPDPDYQTFRTTPANFNRPPIIYVAANDGMLHGFCAVAGAGCAQGGAELFAYVPSMIYSKLNELTRQGYVHRYYVDSTPTVTDAKVGGAWKTVLVGGLGGGGSGYYALDVTDPANITEGGAANTVLWEFTKADDPTDMGVSLSTAQVVRMKNGQFAAVFGNGYNSASGKAILYVAFLDGGTDGSWTIGTDVIKITLDSSTADNGLSSPVVSDVDFDGFADYIYAGDLNGVMWRVDVTSANPNQWDIATNKLKLFTARDGSGNVQPITSAPEVTKSPAGGYMVLFGTGKYLELSDTSGPYKTQSFYSVLDNQAGVAPKNNLARANLDQRTIATTSIGGVTYRTVTGTSGANARGWYVDLPIAGERVVYAPQLRAGKVIFVTLIPSSSPCEAGGTSWLLEVDPITGKPLTDPVFDTNGDGLINTQDVLVSGRQSTVGITPAPTFIGGQSAGGNRDNPRKFLSGSSGAIETVINSDKGSSGRLSWRELLKE